MKALHRSLLPLFISLSLLPGCGEKVFTTPGATTSTTTTTTTTTPTTNTAPTAAIATTTGVPNGGTLPLNTAITLDGSKSTDAQTPNTLTYAWTITDPTGAGSSAATPTVHLLLSVTGTYTIQLTVSDGSLTNTATFSLTADSTLPDTAPVAVITAKDATGTTITPPGPVTLNTTTGSATIVLDGTGSNDADGNSLTYAWTVTTPTNPTPTNVGNTSIVSYTLTSVGNYAFQLVVNDGLLDSPAATFSVTAQ